MRKIYRSRRDCKVFGLCGGLAELINVDATLLRLVVVLTTFFSGGTVLVLYILASMVIPKEPIFDPPFMAGPPPHFNPGSHTYTTGHTFMGNHSYGAGSGHSAGGSQAGPQQGYQQPPQSNLDEMMKDIEKKALQKEITELRAKLAQFEKGDE